VSDRDQQSGRIFDDLAITPEQFAHIGRDIGREAVSTVDEIEPVLVSPRKFGRPFSDLWRINLDAFDQDLQAALDGQGVGYCYMIRRKSVILHLRSSGWAQLPGDGEVGWGFHVPMNIASVSKFVSAVAAVRLLDDVGISLMTPNAGFLPAYWTQGSGTAAITFHDILRHESGLGSLISDSGTGSFAEAKDEISRGSTGTGTYNYKNVNFAILRILFGPLTNTVSPASVPPSFLGMSNDVFWDVASALAYSKFVNDHVFVPASIAPREFDAPENAAKAYVSPPMAPGASIVDGPGASGQSGWHLSIGELVRLLGAFRAGSMMPRRRGRELLSNMYGLDGPLSTRAGAVYYKGGRKLSNGRGMDSAIYLMPREVDFAVFVNSWDGTSGGFLEGIPGFIENNIEFIF
jgi:hypothetical protein